MVKIIDSCNINLFEELCTDEKVPKRLLNRLRPARDDANRRAYTTLAKLVTSERCGSLQTSNAHLAEHVNSARAARFVHRLRSFGFEDGKVYRTAANFRALATGLHLSNEDSAVYDIHDMLKAYYNVSVKRFVDNVTKQVVEDILLGEDGPVKFFSQHYVLSLDSKDIEGIASEEESVAEERADLNRKIASLKEAIDICAE